jgi:hypothetical protein
VSRHFVSPTLGSSDGVLLPGAMDPTPSSGNFSRAQSGSGTTLDSILHVGIYHRSPSSIPRNAVSMTIRHSNPQRDAGRYSTSASQRWRYARGRAFVGRESGRVPNRSLGSFIGCNWGMGHWPAVVLAYLSDPWFKPKDTGRPRDRVGEVKTGTRLIRAVLW